MATVDYQWEAHSIHLAVHPYKFLRVITALVRLIDAVAELEQADVVGEITVRFAKPKED